MLRGLSEFALLVPVAVSTVSSVYFSKLRQFYSPDLMPGPILKCLECKTLFSDMKPIELSQSRACPGKAYVQLHTYKYIKIVRLIQMFSSFIVATTRLEKISSLRDRPDTERCTKTSKSTQSKCRREKPSGSNSVPRTEIVPTQSRGILVTCVPDCRQPMGCNNRHSLR